MARAQGTSARSQRLIAGVATALVGVAAAIALGRVFEGNGPTLRLMAAGAGSAVIASMLERRNLVLATIISGVALAFAIGLLVLPQTTWYGLPGLETLRVAIEAAGRVGEQARVQVAPSPPLAPLLLAGLAGTWAAVFASHALAFRAGSPLLALLPPVALVGFADSVLDDLVRPVFGLLFLASAAALLFADAMRRVQGWGPVWTAQGRDARLDVVAGRSARRVASAAVVVAALAPALMPGFGSRGVIDFSTSDDGRVRIDPLVSVQASLSREEVTPVFEVRADVGMYWRMVALPNFDGQVWSPDEEPPTLPVVAGTPLVASTPPLAAPAGTTEVTFTTTSELAQPWLPLPHPPRSTDAQLEGMRWDPQGGSIALGSGIEPGVTYTAVADIVRPTADELRAEVISATNEALRYTVTPDDLPAEVRGLAQRWTRDATNDYERIIAIQEQFTRPGNFTYNDDVPASTSDDALVEFLTESRQGFCQQFSSAMAIMLRSLGVPARLAVGFTPGRVDPSGGRFTVTTENAHSWVEVLFPRYGWVPFEPTPNRQNLTAYPYLDPAAAQPCPDPPCGGPGGTQVGQNTQENAANSSAAREGGGLGLRPDFNNGRLGRGGGGAIASGVANAAPDPGPFTTGNALLSAVAIGAITLALLPPVRALGRRRRLRRARRAPRSLILATYDVFADRAAELGYPRRVGQTIEEYRAAVASSGVPVDGDLTRLSMLATTAAYSAPEPDEHQAEEATRTSHAVLRAMRRHAGWKHRVTGPYRRR
ncbi:MAG TPA: transglutaminaseTgpA domain-containing protein [Actinomycetota bacterium]|nr:transglutaminaseTgpA domain-containing protein [Actinomycetota bacterium]